MDFVDALPLIIFGLIYLFGSSKKKEAEKQKKKEAQLRRESSGVAPERDAPVAKRGGLQQRLADALAQMEQRMEEAKPIATNAPEPASQATPIERSMASETNWDMAVSRELNKPTLLEQGRAESDLVSEHEFIDGGIERMSGPAGFTVRLDDGRPVRSTKVAEELAQQYEFTSLLEEVPNETYHGHGFNNFNQAHGLHYGETEEERDASSRIEIPTEVESVRTLLATPAAIRRAVIVSEIIGKPVSQRKT